MESRSHPEHFLSLPSQVGCTLPESVSYFHSLLWMVVVASLKCNLSHAAKKSPSLISVFLSCWGRTYFILGFVKLCCDILAFSGPVLLSKLVNFIQNRDLPVYYGYNLFIFFISFHFVP